MRQPWRLYAHIPLKAILTGLNIHSQPSNNLVYLRFNTNPSTKSLSRSVNVVSKFGSQGIT